MYQNGICWGNGVVFLSKTYFSSLIKRENTDPVAMHFYTNEHSVDDCSVIGIEKLYKDEIYRKFRENLWKKKLNTYMPLRINKRVHYCV